jgi:hypothetical protein
VDELVVDLFCPLVQIGHRLCPPLFVRGPTPPTADGRTPSPVTCTSGGRRDARARVRAVLLPPRGLYGGTSDRFGRQGGRSPRVRGRHLPRL